MQEWADFARQLSGLEQTSKMQDHLDGNCRQCLGTMQSWGYVMNFAIRDRSYEPPAWSVQAVKASFAVAKVITGTTKLDIATVMFDSALQPAPAGLRGTAAVARQLLYKSGSVCIDMRMEPKPGSDSLVLVGQLLDAARPDHGISGIPINLLCKGDTISSGETNDIGEFDFGIAMHDHLQLVFGISKHRSIVVPVPSSENSLS